uniref:Ovule protein n=1 Tax=Rodentolepis nana TaxID=102285 RepID=A0A0R3T8Y3_RODNA
LSVVSIEEEEFGLGEMARNIWAIQSRCLLRNSSIAGHSSFNSGKAMVTGSDNSSTPPSSVSVDFSSSSSSPPEEFGFAFLRFLDRFCVTLLPPLKRKSKEFTSCS